MSNLPEIVKRERDVMVGAPGAILRRLPHFLGALSSSRETRLIMSQLEEELNKREREEFQNMKDAVGWVEEKINFLRNSLVSPHPDIEQVLKLAQDVSEFKGFSPFASHLDSIMEVLWAVVDAIATSKDRHLLQGWVSFSEDSRGQIHWLIIYPQCVAIARRWQDESGLRNWKELRDSDPVTLYSYLKNLSQYSTYKSLVLVLPLKNDPRSLEESNALYVKGRVGLYLSTFDSDNPPDTSEEVLSFVDTFLCGVVLQVARNKEEPNKNKRKGSNKNDPRVRDREKGENWMREEWEKDTKISHPLMADRFMRAMRNKEVVLEKEYKRSTFEAYAKSADPRPLEEKLKQPKTPNKKEVQKS